MNKNFRKGRNQKSLRKNGSNKKKSQLDPSRLISKAEQEVQKDFQPRKTFKQMQLDERLKETLNKKGFQKPTEIQEKTLEAILTNRDVLGIAQTGTGKTGAFIIPIIQQMLSQKPQHYALVVVPTRELATQVEMEFRSLTKGMGLYSSCFIGGTNLNKDLSSLRRKSNIVIATPGRLLDLVQRKAIDLRSFNTLVLDEFDRMLDMGFINDVQRIIYLMKNRQQTLLFSATINKSQQRLIDEIVQNPAIVKVSNGVSTGKNVSQDIVKVQENESKLDVLCDMLNSQGFEKIILFEETKHKVNRLTTQLNKRGISALEIHGNKSQNARQKALDAFKGGKVKVLVATDVAARGIDVDDVTHVINYQVPQTYDTYIHRIGRTGRAGKVGQAYTFVQ